MKNNRVIKLLTFLCSSVLILGIANTNVFAAMMDQVVIRGRVYNITRSVVLLKTETGKIAIPRQAFKKQKLYNNRKVAVEVSLSEIVELNKKRKARNKKRRKPKRKR